MKDDGYQVLLSNGAKIDVNGIEPSAIDVRDALRGFKNDRSPVQPEKLLTIKDEKGWTHWVLLEHVVAVGVGPRAERT